MNISALKAIIPRKGSFAANVLVLISGTALGQLLVITTSPIITRIYSPSDFGVFAVYASILSILVIIVSLRYEMAIPLPDDDGTAANILALSSIIVLLISLLTLVVMFLLGTELCYMVNMMVMKPFLYLIPLGLLGGGSYQILTYWAVRKGSFVQLARTNVTRSFGQVSTQIGVGLWHEGLIGLLIGEIVGRASGNSFLALSMFKRDKEPLRKISFKGMRWAGWRYRKFPIIATGSGLMNVLGLQLPTILLASFYGPKVAGWFMLSQRMIDGPIGLLSQASAKVYLGEAASIFREKPHNLKKLFLKIVNKLSLLALLPTLILVLLGAQIFGLFFGAVWEESGKYVQIMAPMFFLKFVMIPLSQTLYVLEKLGWQVFWDAMRLILVAGGLYLTYQAKWSPLLAILVYSVIMSVMYIMLFFINLHALAVPKAKTGG